MILFPIATPHLQTEIPLKMDVDSDKNSSENIVQNSVQNQVFEQNQVIDETIVKQENLQHSDEEIANFVCNTKKSFEGMELMPSQSFNGFQQNNFQNIGVNEFHQNNFQNIGNNMSHQNNFHRKIPTKLLPPGQPGSPPQ